MSDARTLNELVIALHFDGALSLSVLDFADLIQRFSARFPISQQMAPGAPVDLEPSISVQMMVQPVADLPRVILRDPSSQRNLHLQGDRIGFGWARAQPLGDPDSYPGYPTMRTEWEEVLREFYAWHDERLGGTPGSRLLELSYHNGCPIEMDGKRRRLSEIFRFVQPGNRPLNSFQVTWSEFLEPRPDSPRVIAQAGLALAPPAQSIFAFNFVGLAKSDVVGTDPASLESLDSLHSRIIEMHAGAIAS